MESKFAFLNKKNIKTDAAPSEKVETPSFYAIIRHGERGNAVPGFVFKNKFDPPLTPLGIEQATVTGQFLRSYFEYNNWKFDKIIIETSPFLRSMQTAAWTAHELGVNQIWVNYQISENITTTDPGQRPLDWHFTENPMPHLEYIQSECEFSKMKRDTPEYGTQEFFPSENLTFTNIDNEQNEMEKNLIIKAFPEKGQDVFERALRIGESAIQNLKQYANELTKDEKPISICYLQFSHGQFIDSLAHLFNQNGDEEQKERPEAAHLNNLDSIQDEQRPDVVSYLQNVKYGFPSMCSLSGFTTYDVNSNDGRKSVFTNFQEHVSNHLRKQ